LAAGVDALLVGTAGSWTALMPLRAASGAIDAAAVKAALAAAGAGDAYFVDLKRESDRLYGGYLREASLLSLAGLAAILALLGAVTRSPRRVFHIVAPLAAAVAVVVAGLLLAGKTLILLHLVGMLLIVAVGSNYALFFDQGAAAGGIAPRTLVSLLLASATTVAGFGILAFSSVPVLNAIGTTVGPGVVLALVCSEVLARRA
ncbi:MAG: MMPL family transporter, partial [Thiobacillus sp.]